MIQAIRSALRHVKLLVEDIFFACLPLSLHRRIAHGGGFERASVRDLPPAEVGCHSCSHGKIFGVLRPSGRGRVDVYYCHARRRFRARLCILFQYDRRKMESDTRTLLGAAGRPVEASEASARDRRSRPPKAASLEKKKDRDNRAG